MAASKRKRPAQYGQSRRVFAPVQLDSDSDDHIVGERAKDQGVGECQGQQRRAVAVAVPHEEHRDMFFPSTDQIDHSQEPPPPPRNRPTSQKAATMAVQADPAKVETLVQFGLDRETAIRYLKAKHNDVDAAINAAFDGEDVSQAENASTWDEGVWTSTDRDGNREDQYLQPLGASSAAATRPNSPALASMRQQMHPSSQAEEEDDLAKALQMSRGVDIPGGMTQETGRIGADGQETRFGPATKKEYDNANWGMVPFNTLDTTDEVVPDLEVADRANGVGQPRCLKYLPDGDYTPAFLTICHSIAGVREALLMRDHLQTSYGQDSEWWKGHPIALPKIVHVHDGSTVASESDDTHDEFIAEIQRLMAFLTSSDRSCASVGPLTQTSTIKQSSPAQTRTRTLLELVISSWVDAAASKMGNDSSHRNIFTTTVGTNAPEGMDTPDMYLVDLPVHLAEGEKSDLFERLDDLLWDASGEMDNASDNYIERPAEVVVVRVYQQNSSETQLRMEVPATFHIDKYLSQNVESTRVVRAQMAKYKKRIAKIESLEKRLRMWQHPTTSSALDAKALLTHTLGYYDGRNRAGVLAADSADPAPVDGEGDEAQMPQHALVAQQLQAIVASIDDKLNMLAEEKQRTRWALGDMSRCPPPGLGNLDLEHRYTLRGVATKSNITYVLRPSTDDEERPEGDDTPEGWQWWRIEYEVNASGGAKIIKTPTADYDVLRAVELEHNSALLVYASDTIRAGLPGAPALPAALQDFIDRDNELFRQELAHEHAKPPTYTYPTETPDAARRSDVIPSIEVERRGSMDSTRADGSPSPPPFDEMLLDQQHHPSEFGLGYDVGRSRAAAPTDDDTPVHEIRLSEEDDEGIVMEPDAGEAGRAQILPGPTAAADAVMPDADAQDHGMGGGAHVEDIGRAS